MAAFILAFMQTKGLHGHYVCTESRWPSITCYLGKQSWAAESSTWAPKAAVIFLPEQVTVQRSSGCESQPCPRTQPPGSSAVCSTAAGSACWGLAEQTQSWATGQKLFPGHTAPCFQTLMGLHTLPISFFPESQLFLVLLQINLSLTFVWSDCSKMWHQSSAFSRCACLALLMAH